MGVRIHFKMAMEVGFVVHVVMIMLGVDLACLLKGKGTDREGQHYHNTCSVNFRGTMQVWRNYRFFLHGF